MIIYFCLFIPLLFLSADSSSIRGRNYKNDLVPYLSSRLDTLKKDPDSIKVVSKEPFVIQLQMPNPKETEARGNKQKDKITKLPEKKRVLKIKPLRKKQRKRRDLLSLKAKPREEKIIRFEIPRAANKTEKQIKNVTRNSFNRKEILKALSSYPRKSKLEEIRNAKDDEKIGKTRKNYALNRNLHKLNLSLADRAKLTYPSTPKLDRQRYTYKDLMADRERLEQKIKYIKNMLNDSTADDAVRVRRRSDSDRAANKIAKMFLTLSAVNGLHDKKKSKCNDDDDEDRVEDVWEKERRNNPLRKSTSSNEERYKVKKWIEFMKNKRSSGKVCPCMGNAYGEDSDAFPLEQKLPKGYFLLERGRSSEESSESYRDPIYYSKDKTNRNDNVKKRLSKTQDQDGKAKALSKNGKRRLEVPFEDLELYRSRARQILQNAEEILDKIKEEEEKRLAAPNIMMSQLKELTSRIHGDPRNNENDLIRVIQKNLGWAPLTKPQDNADGTFLDNVKSFILDPYEKAKALTDESTRKLSSYLLRNLGKLQESSEEQEARSTDDKADDENLKIYFGEVPPKEEPPSPASLAREEPVTAGLSKSKEDLQHWEDTLSEILSGGNDALKEENNWDVDREKSSQQEIGDVIKETQNQLNDFNKDKPTSTGDKAPLEPTEIVAESKPESVSEEERVAMTFNQKQTDENNPIESQTESENGIKSSGDPATTPEKTGKDSEIVQKQPFRGNEGTLQGAEGETSVTPTRDLPEEEEFKKEIEGIIETYVDKDNDKKDSTVDEETVQNTNVGEKKAENEDVVAEVFEKHKEVNKDNENVGVTASPEMENYTLKEGPSYLIEDERVEKKSDASSQTISPINEPPIDESGPTPTANSKEIVRADLAEGKPESNEEPVLKEERKFDSKQDEEEVKASSENAEEVGEPAAEKESPIASEELLKESKKEDSLEIIQKESSTKTQPEHADLVQEAKQQSKELSKESPIESNLGDDYETLEGEVGMGKELIHDENRYEEAKAKENENDETVEAVLDSEGIRETKESTSQEDTSEDQNAPLRATLEKEEQSKETLDSNKSISKESDDDALVKETKIEEEKKEALEEDKNEETVGETSENKSQEILREEKTQSGEKPKEDVDDQSEAQSVENDEDETILKEAKPDEEGDETPPKAVMSIDKDQNPETQDGGEAQENVSSELKETDESPNDETYLKATAEKEQDSEKDDDMTVKAESPNDDTKNENLNEDQETIITSAKSTEDVGSKKDNEESDTSDETLKEVLDIQENLDKVKATTGLENQNGKSTGEDDDETIVRAETPDENMSMEDEETSQETLKAISSQETENLKEKDGEETLKEANPENVQNVEEENDSSETLKAIPMNEKESLQVDENEMEQDNLKSNIPDEDENVEAVLEKEIQEKMEEGSDEETLKAVNLDEEIGKSQEKTSLESTLENQENEELKDDIILKEANYEELEDSLRDNDNVEAVLDNREEQSDENEQNFYENESKRNEGDINDENVLVEAKNFNEDVNDQNSQNYDETLKMVPNEQDQESLEENVRAENLEEDEREKEIDDETQMRGASLEDEFDNKIEDYNPLKSAQYLEDTDDYESIKNVDEGREETLRAEQVSHDINNQIEEENEDEAVLKSVYSDGESQDGLQEDSYETIRGQNLDTPLLASNLRDENSQENLRISPMEHLTGKSLKTSKVPKSIGKIINDLDGQEKSDITSMQSLNPEKIDLMLGKIGKAEQQNLLENDEEDCRKECACAEEMNTRSRNIGRYEIVKDFLHWVKDLQMNRVLTDD